MTNIIFGEITELTLPKEKQPKTQQSSVRFVDKHDSFSLYVLNACIEKIEAHLNENSKIECGGLLIGHPFIDIDNPEKEFTLIVDSVPVGSKNSGIGHYTVSPEELISAKSKIPEGLISVGWYHSHPGHGIFLSGADITIMENIYNLDWQVAFVFDTFSGNKGFFHGKQGKKVINIYYLNQKPIIIEAVIRYNCAISAKEEGDEYVLESFKNWIRRNPSKELSHWIQSGMYQNININPINFSSYNNLEWQKEFDKAVNYYQSGKIQSARFVFEQLSTIKRDAKVDSFLRIIKDRKEIC